VGVRMSAFNHQGSSRDAAARLDMTKLFGFIRVAGADAALEDAIGVAYNKRGTETPKGMHFGITEGVPGFPAFCRATEGVPFASTEGVVQRSPTEGPPAFIAGTETPPT
jgi:hypothetical protein